MTCLMAPLSLILQDSLYRHPGGQVTRQMAPLSLLLQDYLYCHPGGQVTRQMTSLSLSSAFRLFRDISRFVSFAFTLNTAIQEAK